MNRKRAVQISELVTLEQLQLAGGEWDELWRECPNATIFQSPEWLIPWWRYFGTGNLRSLVFRQNEQLVGFAPIFILPSAKSDIREVLLLGTGNSDYLDTLAKPGFEAEVSLEFFRYLEQHAESWDTCDFQELRPDSILLSKTNCASLLTSRQPQSICPVLILPKSEADLQAAVPERTREKLRYYRHRLEKSGRVRTELATSENFDEVFDAFLRLHAKRWHARESLGVLAGTAMEKFHREVARSFLRRDTLRLFALRFEDQIIATLYCLRSRDRLLYYLAGFDPDFARFSPGTVLIGHALEAAVREGMTEFDFLRGQESYKYAWGARDRLNHSLHIHRAVEVAIR